MRILHTADWHVGKVLKGRSRIDEHDAVLADIVRVAQEEERALEAEAESLEQRLERRLDRIEGRLTRLDDHLRAAPSQTAKTQPAKTQPADTLPTETGSAAPGRDLGAPPSTGRPADRRAGGGAGVRAARAQVAPPAPRIGAGARHRRRGRDDPPRRAGRVFPGQRRLTAACATRCG